MKTLTSDLLIFLKLQENVNNSRENSSYTSRDSAVLICVALFLQKCEVFTIASKFLNTYKRFFVIFIKFQG